MNLQDWSLWVFIVMCMHVSNFMVNSFYRRPSCNTDSHYKNIAVLRPSMFKMKIPWLLIWYIYIKMSLVNCLVQERLKRRNTLGCLDQNAAQNSKYARPDPQSHHNPQPQNSSSSGTLNMIPPWNIHTVKQSMPRSCSNGCSLNWFTPSEFFQFSQLAN